MRDGFCLIVEKTHNLICNQEFIRFRNYLLTQSFETQGGIKNGEKRRYLILNKYLQKISSYFLKSLFFCMLIINIKRMDG